MADLKDLLIGGGFGLLGSYLTARPQNRYAEQQRELQQAEMARRNQMQGQMAPMLAHWMGIRNPQQIRQYQQAALGNTPPQQQQAAGGGAESTPTASKVLGAAGAGLGVAGALGIGGAAVPFLGPALLGGAYAAKKIGAGRRAANQATADSGYEGQLKNTLEQMSAQGGSLQDLEQAYQQYLAATQAAMAAGGNRKKVAQQSLANQPLQGTYQTLRRQLGGA